MRSFFLTLCSFSVIIFFIQEHIIGHGNRGSWKGEDEVNTKGIDYILNNIVGGNGIAQWKIVFFGFIMNAAGGVPLLVHMFAAHTPDHHCKVPICEGGNTYSSNDSSSSWMSYAIPLSSSTTNFLKPMSKYDSCFMFKVLDPNGDCEKDNFDSNSIVPCNEWVYDTSLYEYTLTTEYSLVCGDESKNRLLGTLMMMGLMIGSLVGGKLGDYFGRKKACFMSISVIVPCIVLSGFAPSFPVYAGLRLLNCICIPIQWVGAKSLLIEVFGTKGREKCVAIKDTFAPIYMVVLGTLAYLIRDYQNLHLSVGIICILSLSTWFFIPESIRWDIANNQKERARETLLKIAHDNRRVLSVESHELIDKILERIHVEFMKSENMGKHQIWDMFKKGQRRISFILILNWITVCVTAYTLTLNITTLSGNIYVNFILSGLSELPASLVLYFFLKIFGRRFNLFIYQTFTVISCVLMAVIPKSMSTLILIIFLFGKASAGAGFEIAWLLPMELYPTNLRAQAVGTCSTIARLFGMSAAFIGALAVYWQPLPLLIIGIPTLIAGLSAFFLPETSGKNLPQTIQKVQDR
ncbi:organic cation transporter-like protein [Lepeophtheirus salmonis]|uniref:organic cation transporter-like protein n=1 Tax=Lepeophtheirus salmonis TaxID=72036 RepID=UPI001AE9C451|nr:organic cation transporter-like protein [Lepeophtheirus salmonis]